MQDEGKDQGQKAQPGFWQVVASVVAAFFGVQSEHNRSRDFQAGRPSAYIFVGLAMAILLVLIIWGLVQLVTGLAGV